MPECGNIDAVTARNAARPKTSPWPVCSRMLATNRSNRQMGARRAAEESQGLPNRHGFDYFFGYFKQGHAHNYYPDYLWRNQSKVKLPMSSRTTPSSKHNVSSKSVEYSHDLFAKEALKFVREHKDQPFFLDLSLTIPHANDEAATKAWKCRASASTKKRDWPAPQKGYAAMVTRMDGDIGRLLALLKE